MNDYEDTNVHKEGENVVTPGETKTENISKLGWGGWGFDWITHGK